ASSPPHLDLHSSPTRRSSDLDLVSREQASLPIPNRRAANDDVLRMPKEQMERTRNKKPHPLRFLVTMRPRMSWPTKKTKIEFRRSEEHTSELQSRFDLVCRLL